MSDQWIRALLEEPVLGGTETIRLADEYADAFARYELWVLHGRPEGQLDLASIPHEHRMMATHWPDAFEVYRHALAAYLERNRVLRPWSAVVRSMLSRARHADPAGFEHLIQLMDKGTPRFIQQKRNATLSFMSLDNDSPLSSRVRAGLRAFSDYYEIDFVLWFLAVLGRANRTGLVEASAFGGPLGRVAQGSIIGQVERELAGTPLESFFAEAFDPGLRNAIQHNDYELSTTDGNILLRTLDGSKAWDGEALWRRLIGTNQMLEAVHAAAAYVRLVDSERRRSEFSQAGIVTAAYVLVQNGLPRIYAFQLWCFHEMDPDGLWMDAASLAFRMEADGQERVQFTDQGFTIGEPISQTQFGKELRRRGWAHVTRIPVAPALGLGYPAFERPDGARYEIVGTPDEHVIRVHPEAATISTAESGS